MVVRRLRQEEPRLGLSVLGADGLLNPQSERFGAFVSQNPIQYYDAVVLGSVPRSWAMFTQNSFVVCPVVLLLHKIACRWWVFLPRFSSAPIDRLRNLP